MKKIVSHYLILLIIGINLFIPNLFLDANEISQPTEFIEQPFDVIKYKVEIDFTPSSRRYIEATCTTYIYWKENPTENSYFFNLRELNIDAVTYEGESIEPTEVGTVYDADYHYRVDPSSGKQGDTAVLIISYTGEMKAAREVGSWGGVHYGQNILYAMGVGFTNNYVSATQHWMPCYDHPSDKALFEGRFIIPAGEVIASCGLLTSIENLDNGTDVYTWQTEVPAATYLLTFALGNLVKLDEYESDVPIEIYCNEKDVEVSEYYFQLVPEMIKCFEAAYGPYPFEKVGYVVTEKGSMEHQTMISMARYEVRSGFFTNDSTALTGAHELSHQWWGDDVSPLDFRHVWINEGFAEYSESLWMEYLGGPEEYWLDVQESINDYFERVVPGEGNLPLYNFDRTPPSSNYPRTIYDKGAAVIGMLRFEMGDELFFKALKDFLKNNSGGNFTTESLKESFEQSSDMDLTKFFEQWIYRKGHPIVHINEDGAGLRIKQIQGPEIELFDDFYMCLVYQWSEIQVFDTVHVTEQDQFVYTETLQEYGIPDTIFVNTGEVSLHTLVKVNGFSHTSVADNIEISDEIKIYPNPVIDMLSFELARPTSGVIAKVMNELGNEVIQRRMQANSGSNYQIDVTELPSGVFILLVQDGNRIYRKKFVLIR
jgi:aminopeptidase N